VGLVHYVERHAVVLPEEFVAGAARRGWRISGPSEGCDRCPVDYDYWAQYSKSLPVLTDFAGDPDPLVFKTVCAVVRFPETVGIERETEPFAEDVWDGLPADGYGYENMYQIHKDGFYEFQLEHVPVERWDTLMAVVVEGLNRYSLAHRAVIVRIEADPGEWHRDRECLLWKK
jgi:hypothetical protein